MYNDTDKYVFVRIYVIYYTLFFLSPSRDKGAIIGHVLQYNNIMLLFIIYYYYDVAIVYRRIDREMDLAL